MALELKQRRRRKLSMTSLIDVIFLLLLFFMLSSTFSKFGEVELTGTSRGGSTDTTRLFLQVSPQKLNLNGAPVEMTALRDRVSSSAAEATVVLISLAQTASAQRLVDVLATLRDLPNIDVLVIG